MVTRRELLQAIALATAVGVAGCTGRADEPPTECVELANEPDYKGWFKGVDNYVKTCDMRGQDPVTVMVGTNGNDAYWGFGPAAVAVTPGTTVVWEWTGKGGAHDVVSEKGVFTSGEPTDDAGTVFEHTFDSPGVYKYSCTPHEAMGMKGAIFVALE